MSINYLIEELKQKEIKIAFSAGKLKYSGPEENLSQELVDKLKRNKGKLIKYFWPKELGNLMPINTEGKKIPLFIVHGDNSNYIISDYFGPEQPVYGFFHPGSEGEAIDFRSVEEMAQSYMSKILEVFPTGPFYLIGFSFGGILAFEMSIQLRKLGYDVPFLVIIDSASPLAREKVKWQHNIFLIIRKNFLGPFRRKLSRVIKSFICESYVFMRKPIPIQRRSFYMLNKYSTLAKKYNPSIFDGGILLFKAKENPSSYKYLGWDKLVRGIKMIEIDGTHLEVFLGKSRNEVLQTEIQNYLVHVNGLV